jgi:hypothetical protein
MAGDYLALRAELAKPDLAGLSDAAASAKLASDVVTALRPGAYLNERGILNLLGPTAGDAAMSAIEAAGEAGNSLLARVVRILHDPTGEGIDFGTTAVQAQLDALTAAGVLSAAQSGPLKAYGMTTTTRAQAVAGWGLPASAADVAHARSLS